MEDFKNKLPPEFNTWTELYRYMRHHFNDEHEMYGYIPQPEIPVGVLPEKCSRYEFEKDFIKARVFDEISDKISI